MGGITRSLKYWFEYFRDMFKLKDFHVTGSITLGNGYQEVGVPTDLPNPQKVFISIEEPDQGVSVCVGSLNWVATVVQENGFTIYTDVKGDSCRIVYVVEYDCDKVKM